MIMKGWWVESQHGQSKGQSSPTVWKPMEILKSKTIWAGSVWRPLKRQREGKKGGATGSLTQDLWLKPLALCHWATTATTTTPLSSLFITLNNYWWNYVLIPLIILSWSTIACSNQHINSWLIIAERLRTNVHTLIFITNICPLHHLVQSYVCPFLYLVQSLHLQQMYQPLWLDVTLLRGLGGPPCFWWKLYRATVWCIRGSAVVTLSWYIMHQVPVIPYKTYSQMRRTLCQ